MNKYIKTGIVLLSLWAGTSPAPTWATTVTGKLLDPQGNAIANGKVTFLLTNYGVANVPRVASTNVIVNTHPIALLADSLGNVSGTIQGNDTITPAGTLYLATYYAGAEVYLSCSYSITGATFDLNSATCVSTIPAVPPNQAYTTVFNQGSALVQRNNLNFTGTGVSCADNSASSRTDCAITGGGGGGTPGGSTTQVQYNNAGAFGGASNVTYDSSSGKFTVSQLANANETFYGKRFTDISPAGNFIRFQNAAGAADLLAFDVAGSMTAGSVPDARLSSAYSGTGSCSANNWVNSLSRNTAPSCAQPAFADLSGSIALGQTPLTTRGDLLTVNATPGLSRLALGTANKFLGVSGSDPAWLLPFGASTASVASFNMPAGTAPAAPAIGDSWGVDPGSGKDRQFWFRSNTGFNDLLNAVIWSSRDYYICPLSATGTCTYDGDAGTTATPSDSNDGLTKATPVKTFTGLQSKVAGKALAPGAVVAFHVANSDTTNCFQPNAVTFDNEIWGGAAPNNYFDPLAGITDSYPSAYLSFVGDTTTNTNTLLTGAATCAGTASSASVAIRIVRGAARFRGLQFKYFGNATIMRTGAVECEHSTCYLEDVTATSDNKGFLVRGDGPNGHLKFGSTSGKDIKTVDTGVFAAMEGTLVDCVTPIGATTVSASFDASYSGTDGRDLFLVHGPGSYFTYDKCSIQIPKGAGSTSGTFNAFAAEDMAKIHPTDYYQGTATQTFQINASNATLYRTERNGIIIHGCPAGGITCGTLTYGRRLSAQRGSFISANTAAGSLADVIAGGSFFDDQSGGNFPGNARLVLSGAAADFTAAPGVNVGASGNPFQSWTDGSQGTWGHTNYGSSGFQSGLLQFTRYHGTKASPSAVLSGDWLFAFNGVGYDGTGTGSGAQWQVVADANWTSTSHPARIDFYTQAVNGTGNPLLALRLDSKQNWIMGNAKGQHINTFAAASDTAGTISLSAATSASVTFATAYTSAPSCVITPTSNLGATTWWVTTSTTAVTANVSASSTVTFNYHCIGNPN